MTDTMAKLVLTRVHDHGLGCIDAEDRRWSWAEMVTRGATVGAVLRTMADPDQPLHVGVLLPNTLDYLDWLIGAALVGATIVGINPTRRGQQLSNDITSVDCQIIVTDAEGRALLHGLDLGAASGRSITVDDPAYRDLLDDVDPDDVDAVLTEAESVAPSDLYLLLFTSGTTGTPKAVRCTQGRLATIAQTAGANYGFTRDDVGYCPMPLFHGNAIMALWAPSLWAGGAVAPAPKFSASKWLNDVRRTGATKFTYVGKAVAYLLATSPRPEDRDHRLQMGFGTEASLPDRLAFAERFGVRLIEGYGSSEGGINIIASPDTPLGALGPAPAGMDVVIVNEALEECPPAAFDADGKLVNAEAAIGEIVNRTGAVRFEGYYERPDAEADRIRNGWYWSGDLGYRDSAGYFYFAGRSGDWLRVDSENMAAGPIEAVVSRYEPFSSVLIYGVPSPHGGDEVMAAVELRKGATFNGADFAAWLAAQPDLGTKWAPSFVRVMDHLPETATGKLTKVTLKAEGLSVDDPIYWTGRRRSDPYPPFDDEAAALFNS